MFNSKNEVYEAKIAELSMRLEDAEAMNKALKDYASDLARDCVIQHEAYDRVKAELNEKYSVNAALSSELDQVKAENELLRAKPARQDICPFCGSKHLRLNVQIRAHSTLCYVECNDCGTLGPNATTQAEALRKWGKRC